jgi:hypothetical protein
MLCLLVPSLEQAFCCPVFEGCEPFISYARTGSVLLAGANMNYTIELVAQAIHDAEQVACRWDDESAIRKERFREYARNAITLLDDDIGVLLLALQEATTEACLRGPRAAA